MAEDSFLLDMFTMVSMVCAIIGVLFILLLPRDERERRIKATGAFIFGMTGLTISFLVKNPNVLESAQEHIALTLIGMVIATLSVIRLLKT